MSDKSHSVESLPCGWATCGCSMWRSLPGGTCVAFEWGRFGYKRAIAAVMDVPVECSRRGDIWVHSSWTMSWFWLDSGFGNLQVWVSFWMVEEIDIKAQRWENIWHLGKMWESCWPFSEYSKAAKYTLKNDIKIHFQLAWSWVCSLKVFFLTISHIQLEMSFRSPVCLSYLRWEFSVYIFLLSCLSFLLSFSTKEVLFNSVFLCLRFILVSMLFICGVITWTTMKSCGHFVKNAGDRLQNILYNWTIQLRHWDVYLYTGMCV